MTRARPASAARRPARGGAAADAVAVRIDVPRAALPVPAAALRRAVVRAVALAGFPGRLSVAVVGDDTMRTLNRDYHGCDEPTDVLAFALGRPRGGAASQEFDGEVIVSIDTARLEAGERGVPLVSEVLLYVVHGTLHLMGEDDHDPASYVRMHDRALSILAALGHANTIDPAHAKLGGRRARTAPAAAGARAATQGGPR